jgi:hypothetical protein
LITRGSKFFYTAGVIGFLSALAYGFITAARDSGGAVATVSSGGVVEAVVGPITLGWKGSIGDHVGFSALMAFALAMVVLGLITSGTRDGSAEALAARNAVDVSQVAAPAQPIGYSIWPMFAAISGALVLVGTAFSSFLFYAGLIGLVIAGFEWVVRSWTESKALAAGADGSGLSAHDGLREQVLSPIELPLVVVLAIAVVAVAISRVLLAVPKNGAVFVIIIVAAVVFGLANLLARRPELSRTVVIWVLVVGGVILIGSGIAAGISGEREIEEHHAEEGHGEEGAVAVIGSPGPSDPGVSAGTSGY